MSLSKEKSCQEFDKRTTKIYTGSENIVLAYKKKGETVKSKYRCPIVSKNVRVSAPQARRAERLLTDAIPD